MRECQFHGKTEKNWKTGKKHIKINSFHFAMKNLNLGFDAKFGLKNLVTLALLEAPEAKLLH